MSVFYPPHDGLVGSRFFIDVESVTVKRVDMNGKEEWKNLAFEVVLVDIHGQIVYHEFIKIKEPVYFKHINYHITGITYDMLCQKGIPLEQVKDDLKTILEGNTLIGYGLTDDLKSLDLQNWPIDKIDLKKDFLHSDGKPISVRALIYNLDNQRDIQEGEHNCIVDAKAHLFLYKKKYLERIPKSKYCHIKDRMRTDWKSFLKKNQCGDQCYIESGMKYR